MSKKKSFVIYIACINLILVMFLVACNGNETSYDSSEQGVISSSEKRKDDIKESEEMGETRNYDSYIYVDKEMKEDIEDFLQLFEGNVELESFDQGHTDSVVRFAMQKILSEEGLSRKNNDGLYFVETKEIEEFIDQYFEVPEGYLNRILQELSSEKDERAIALCEGRVVSSQIPSPVDIHIEIEYIDEIMGRYVIGGQTWNAMDKQGVKSMFYAILTKDDASGKLLLSQYSIEGENSPYEEVRFDFASDTFLGKYAEDLSNKREQNGEQFVGKIGVDDATFDEINQYLIPFFKQPILGSFTQDDMYSAIVFSVQRMLRTDIRISEYHKSADYYTLELEQLVNCMKDYFIVPEDFSSQIEKVPDSVGIWKEKDHIVFEYRSMAWGDGIEIDQIELKDDAYIVFGHNRALREQPVRENNLLGNSNPFYEFAAVLIRQADGEYRMKEFCIR